MDRMLDKRKARDKESDTDTSDTSTVKNPTKRARVEFSASTSPKDKSPTLVSPQKTFTGKLVETAGTSSAAQLESTVGSNGEINKTSQSSSNKFELPAPFTPEEIEEIGKNSDGQKEDSDDDKYLSGIIQHENSKKNKQNKGKSSSTSNGTSPSSTTNSRRVEKATNNLKPSTKTVHQPTMTSSPNSSDLSQSSIVVGPHTEVQVIIKIIEPTTQHIILEETELKSDFQRMDAFLKQHSLKLSMSSQSGYMGDVSSLESSSGNLQGSSKSSRWTISSLGSTIPRQSIKSIATDASESPPDDKRRVGRCTVPLMSKSRKKSSGPIASSTKVEEPSPSSSLLDRMNVSTNIVSNGEDHLTTTASSKSHSSRGNNSPSKRKQSPSKMDRDEGIGKSLASTPSSSTSRNDTTKRTPGVKVESGIYSTPSDKKPGVRRRGGSASNFPITSNLTVLSTPPPARSVAKIEGHSAKPLSQFEQAMNNEPVLESELEKGATLWSAIMPDELVFARWRDKNYYSGMVKSKGLNDTWIIDYDDGMEDVASESHIVPIRILGVGVKGIYSPDGKYDPHTAEVVGQKFGIDPETGRTAVKYAIKMLGESSMLWCSRRQLSIKESDAKKLRSEFLPPVVIKAGDVSLDNIVSGPRRRTRGGAESAASSSDTPLIAGAFDASTSEEKSTPTPAPRAKPGPKPGSKRTPASATATTASKKRQAAATNTPSTKDASTSSPTKESATNDSAAAPKSRTIIEIGRKKLKKTLFQGLQFILTASGGGDPGISGNPVNPPVPYDKDECRELIESSGGEILDQVGNEAKENVFLVSDSYARTVKYIYCLAASIPCVSHNWIKMCLDQNAIVEWNVFQLPAGWSLERQDLVAHHARKPLKDCKIFVASESDQLYNYWKPVLTAAEANLLKQSRKKGASIPPGTEVVVTDNHGDSTNGLLEEAASRNIPLVKPEWLVQTIILGEKAHMYGHDKYKVLLNDDESDMDDTTEGESGQFNEVLAIMQNPD